MTETLISARQADGFTHESPIRAFTEFRVSGVVAIGKGFRPSLAHLHTYLDAMAQKEGWLFVQVLLPRDNDGDPTILFRKAMYGEGPDGPKKVEPYDAHAAVTAAIKAPGEDTMVAHAEVTSDDPINPKHYAGRECADIGERLSANGYQILKYCWRLGKKDDPCQELGKAVWYAESEKALLAMRGYRAYGSNGFNTVMPNTTGLKSPDAWFQERIAGQDEFVKAVAAMLWQGYGKDSIGVIIDTIRERRFHMECGRGLAL